MRQVPHRHKITKDETVTLKICFMGNLHPERSSLLSFTRKEEKLVHDPYFQVIRETDQFVEIKSINTGHCWNVFKNTIESTMKVVLYHKHKQTDVYYHEHRICRTVADAVDQIKSHDAYVLEKEKQEQPAGSVTERQLKVYEGSNRDYKPVAQIRLQGKWLEECGFEPGTPFTVKCEAGKLTLTTI